MLKWFKTALLPLPLPICEAYGFKCRCGIPIWKITVTIIIISLLIIFGDKYDNNKTIDETGHPNTSNGYK